MFWWLSESLFYYAKKLNIEPKLWSMHLPPCSVSATSVPAAGIACVTAPSVCAAGASVACTSGASGAITNSGKAASSPAHADTAIADEGPEGGGVTWGSRGGVGRDPEVVRISSTDTSRGDSGNSKRNRMYGNCWINMWYREHLATLCSNKVEQCSI